MFKGNFLIAGHKHKHHWTMSYQPILSEGMGIMPRVTFSQKKDGFTAFSCMAGM